MAFLDEEEEQLQQQQQQGFPEEPELPRRRFGGAERRRQQFLIRRLIAVGVGLGFLILIVVGVRGCLEARSDRALRNYAQDVSTIMQESEQRGSEFFELVDNPGDSEQEFEQQVNSLRGASQSLLDRAENIGAPDQMRDAQSAVTLSLKLRRDALQVIAENAGAATADRETADAIEAITQQMGSLYASDILWTQVGSPEIGSVLEAEDVDASTLPAGNFMPEGPEATEYLDQTTIVEKLSAITGGGEAAGTHGLGLLQVDVGDVTLDPDVTTEVPDDAREVEVQVQNQGEGDESGIRVTVTLNGEELAKTIEELAAGESTTVTVPISTLPQPGTEVQLDVNVDPVPGELDSENNQASYTVIFGSEAE